MCTNTTEITVRSAVTWKLWAIMRAPVHKKLPMPGPAPLSLPKHGLLKINFAYNKL